MLFADIVLPRPLGQTFTYRIPTQYANQCLVGHRAIVPFGKEIVVGIILDTHTTASAAYQIKDLLSLPDSFPVFNVKQIDFLKWMSTYYLCTLGEVIRGALSPIKAFVQPKIRLATTYDPTQIYSSSGKALLSTLQKSPWLTYQQAVQIITPSNAITVLKSLLEKKAITLTDSLAYGLPKTTHVCLQKDYLATPTTLAQLQKSLSKSPKQLAVLTAYLRKVGISAPNQKVWLPQKTLVQMSVSAASLKTLLKKNIFLQKKIFTSHFATDFREKPLHACLTTQTGTLENIYTQWKKKNVVLLQGASGSHLIDQYLAIIAQTLQKQGQVLYLLPTIKHIALCMPYLNSLFGKHMGLYHSQRTSQQRLAVWHAVQQKKLNFVVGTRSALFLPFSDLQCIVVPDEENSAYKQTISLPRYHARDAAIILATYHRAFVLLGSTAPSLESYYNAKKGKYGFVALPPLKDKVPINLTLLPRKAKNPATRHWLSPKLIEAIRLAFATYQQVIVLHSTRGYATRSRCTECAWVATCPSCLVSLTYHQTTNQLHCHHCKYTTAPPPKCPICGTKSLKYRGIGIQQVEELLQHYLPSKRIVRIDSDAAPYNKGYLQVLADFNAKKVDLLVSTQGIINLLPLARPTLVAVLDVGAWLMKPNFRAYEQCCQYFAKLAKPEVASCLLVQTDCKSHLPLLHNLIRHSTQQDTTNLYKELLEERKKYGYPPYTRLLKVLLSYIYPEKVAEAAIYLVHQLQAHLSIPVLGPHPIFTKNTKTPHSVAIWLKVPIYNTDKLQHIKKTLLALTKAFSTQAPYKRVRVSFDVDPM